MPPGRFVKRSFSPTKAPAPALAWMSFSVPVPMPGVLVEMLLEGTVRLCQRGDPDTRTILHRQLVQFSYEIVLT